MGLSKPTQVTPRNAGSQPKVEMIDPPHSFNQGWRDTIKLDPCCWCACRPKRRHAQRTVEHIVPRSKGGPNSWDNTVGACRACNGARGTNSLLHWLLKRAGEKI